MAFNTLEEGKIVVEDAFFLVANGLLKSQIAIPDEKTINRIIFFGELDCPLLTIEGNVLNTIVVLTGKKKKGVQVSQKDICKARAGINPVFAEERNSEGYRRRKQEGLCPPKDAVRRLEYED